MPGRGVGAGGRRRLADAIAGSVNPTLAVVEAADDDGSVDIALTGPEA